MPQSVSLTIPAGIVLLVLGGCANNAAIPDETRAYEEREYVTGSNLPVRKRRPATDDERERAQEAARAMRDEQTRSGTLIPSPGRM